MEFGVGLLNSGAGWSKGVDGNGRHAEAAEGEESGGSGVELRVHVTGATEMSNEGVATDRGTAARALDATAQKQSQLKRGWGEGDSVPVPAAAAVNLSEQQEGNGEVAGFGPSVSAALPSAVLLPGSTSPSMDEHVGDGVEGRQEEQEGDAGEEGLRKVKRARTGAEQAAGPDVGMGADVGHVEGKGSGEVAGMQLLMGTAGGEEQTNGGNRQGDVCRAGDQPQPQQPDDEAAAAAPLFHSAVGAAGSMASIRAVPITVGSQQPISPVVTLASNHVKGAGDKELGSPPALTSNPAAAAPLSPAAVPAINISATPGGAPVSRLLLPAHRYRRGASLALQQLRGSVRAPRSTARNTRIVGGAQRGAAAVHAPHAANPLSKSAHGPDEIEPRSHRWTPPCTAGVADTARPQDQPESHASELVRVVEAAVTALSCLLDGSDMGEEQWAAVTRLLDAAASHPAVRIALSLPAAGVSQPSPSQPAAGAAAAQATVIGGKAGSGSTQAAPADGIAAVQLVHRPQLRVTQASVVQQRLQQLQERAGMVRLSAPTSAPTSHIHREEWQAGPVAAAGSPSPDTSSAWKVADAEQRVETMHTQDQHVFGGGAGPAATAQAPRSAVLLAANGTHSPGLQTSKVAGHAATGSSSPFTSSSSAPISEVLRSLAAARCYDCGVASYGQMLGAVFKLGRLAGQLAAANMQQHQLEAQQKLLAHQQHEIWAWAGMKA